MPKFCAGWGAGAGRGGAAEGIKLREATCRVGVQARLLLHTTGGLWIRFQELLGPQHMLCGGKVEGRERKLLKPCPTVKLWPAIWEWVHTTPKICTMQRHSM